MALEEIAQVYVGNPAPPRAEHYSTEGTPFVRMQDVGRERGTRALTRTASRLSPLAVGECPLRLFPAGTVLIPKSGASVLLNHRAMLGCDAYVVSHLAAVVAHEHKVLPAFLFHWSEHYDPRPLAQVTSVPSLPLSLIKRAQVPVPPLDQQQLIVEQLGSAAQILARTQAALDKARALLPALFFDMFGPPEPNPKAWPVRPLSEMAQFFSGTVLPAGLPFIGQEDGLLLCKVSSLSLPQNTFGIAHSLQWSAHPSALSALAPTGSIIFPKRGAAIATNKKSLLLRSACLDPNLMGVLGKKGSLLPRFLLALFETLDLRSISRETAVPQINKKDLSPLRLIAPPLPLQSEFARQAKAIEETIAALELAAALAKSTANALSDEVFGPR